jgi:hypothetical protein
MVELITSENLHFGSAVQYFVQHFEHFGVACSFVGFRELLGIPEAATTSSPPGTANVSSSRNPLLLPQHGKDFFIENPRELAPSVWLGKSAAATAFEALLRSR